jgi:hypothetical protein
MTAYERALHAAELDDGDLSPDSEFFEFLDGTGLSTTATGN